MHRPWGMTAFCAVVIFGSLANVGEAAHWADSLFVEKAHDFGTVPRGGKFRHQFVLINQLKEPISIVNVRASCGCTSGRALVSQLAPGQSGAVEAEMDTRNFVGPKATTLFVTIVTASGREGEAKLGVSSMILSDVVLNPGGIDFGTVTRGQAPVQMLTIERVGQPSWKIERMLSASRILSATLTETARNGSSVSYIMKVSLKPDAPSGTVRDEIRLVTNDPETSTIPILISGQIRGDLTAKPSLLSLGNVASAGGVQGRILVTSSKPFAIQSIEGAGDGFRIAPFEPARKNVHVLTISYRPEEGTSRGDLRRVFRVTTDLPGEAPLEVTAALHVEP